jgi:hypothetical protein
VEDRADIEPIDVAAEVAANPALHGGKRGDPFDKPHLGPAAVIGERGWAVEEREERH